jgi:S1-C subfamily serine protease
VDITPQLQTALNLPAESGVLVQSIEEGGPAEKAGLKPGDQIMAINGVRLQSRAHANRLIFGQGVADTVEMTVNRKDELLKFKVVLAERPNDI